MIKKALCPLLCALFLLSACVATEQVKDSSLKDRSLNDTSGAVIIKEGSDKGRPVKGQDTGIPEFVPVSEELSPLKTRIVSISARATPLREVLHVIAESTGLNLVMEKGVDPEMPVNLTLKNVSAEDALNTIFASVDYFYSVKDNILIVKAMDTKIFEFGQPSVIQDYTADVGGDILGGTMTGTTGGTAGTTGTTGIKGSVAQKIESDKASFRLWDSIEKTIATILGVTGGAQQTPQEVTGGPQLRPSFSINRMTGTIIVTATKKIWKKWMIISQALRRYLTGRSLLKPVL